MKDTQAIEAFSALAHATRLEVVKILVRAGGAGVCAGDLAKTVQAPASTLSTHLAILSRAGLIDARREGRSVYYAANLPQVAALIGYLLEDCCEGRSEVCAPIAAVVERAQCCGRASA